MTNTPYETVGHIGCIDGAVLRVTRSGTETHLHLDDTVAPLSPAAAERLASLLHPAQPPPSTPPPAQLPPSRDASHRMGAAANPSVGDLIQEGLIAVGTVLTFRHHGIEHQATVNPRGDIEYRGQLHATLSAAAKTASGGASINGWTAWKLLDGPPIDHLRWTLRAQDFPGAGHGYATSSANEMNQLARRWVQHALANNLDPARPSEAEVETVLSGHGYAESTLESYRRHLRNWRAMYGRESSVDDSES